jgi:uncharacterized surface protein with fasciclin (FAS1) repeats
MIKNIYGGNTMKKLGSMLVIAFMLVSYLPVQAAEGDIVDIAVSDTSFSTLVAALTEADLVGALQGDGPFTVFAPTNEAFGNLLAALDISAEDLLAHPDLSKVLLYHVVSGKVMSTDLSDGLMAETLNGNKIEVDLSQGVKINTSTVIQADIEATNGVVHVIDEVLVPADFKLDHSMMENTMEEEMMVENDIVDIALSDDSFSMLVSLLQKADLVGALQGQGPFTVFAPTNDAFVDLVTALGITPEELMAQPKLAEVLLLHVASGKVLSSDLGDGLTFATLNGQELTVSSDSEIIAAADIMATNGVVHVINKVLIPEGFVLEDVMVPEEDVPQMGAASTAPYGIASLILVFGLIVLNRKMKVNMQ